MPQTEFLALAINLPDMPTGMDDWGPWSMEHEYTQSAADPPFPPRGNGGVSVVCAFTSKAMGKPPRRTQTPEAECEIRSHTSLKDTAGWVGSLCLLNYQSIHRCADFLRRGRDPREGFQLTTCISSTALFPKCGALHTGTTPTSLRPVF